MAITKIGTPELFDFSATNTALQLPTGDTASRPAAPSTGEWRFNTTDKYVEYWDGGAWRQIDTESAATFTAAGNFNTNTYFGNGATQAIDAKFNEAANFNGSSSQIELPNLGISGAGTRTISAWINVNSLSSTQTILQYGSNSAGQRFGFAIDTAGKLYVEYFGRDAITSSAQITTGSWFNVAVTYNGGAIETATNTQIYVNGSAVAMSTTGTLTGAANTADSNYGIGYDRANARQFFNGRIDQVRIFNTALPATGTASVYTLYNDETTTTAATLNFPAGAGCIAGYQLDGNANDIDGAGTPIDSGQSAVFDGSTSFIDTNAKIPVSLNFSISFWMNSTNTTGGQYVFSTKGSSGTNGWWIIFNGGDFWYGEGNNSLNATTLKSPLSTYGDGNWHQVVVTRAAGGTVNMFIDNNQVITNGSVGPNYMTSSVWAFDLFIGRYAGSNALHYGGKLDQVRVYSSVLSAADVSNIYNETSVPTSNLVSWYKLDGNANDSQGSNNGTWGGTEAYSGPALRGQSIYNGTATDIGYTGLEFQPDLVWAKKRSATQDHIINDSVRGVQKELVPNNTSAEYTTSNGLSSFDSNGFTTGANNALNTSGQTYVAWCWKAGGAPTATNSAGAGNVPTAGSVKIDGADLSTALAGTIAATNISANTAAGFSIVKFAGGNSSGTTVGHGLSQPIELLIVKNLNDGSDNWITWHKDVQQNSTSSSTFTLKGGSVLLLNDTNATIPSYGYDGQMGATSGENLIAYCFHSVAGYQKVGSFNQVQGVTTVSTGFQPRFLMTKRTDAAGDWIIYDSTRGTDKVLYPNTSGVEVSTVGYTMVFNSDGFVITIPAGTYNVDYIYLAIA